VSPTVIEIIAAALFLIALVHTFSTRFFERLAHKRPEHAGLFHLLGEVEVVFGFWAMVLVLAIFGLQGLEEATHYIDSRNFTEPMFVFAIMVVAATRPILQTATAGMLFIGRTIPVSGAGGFTFTVLCIGPLLGSFITEPAAMTLCALILSAQIFTKNISLRLKYAVLGVLFVNISIGGTLTPFAAPPVLMVAGHWGWDLAFMIQNFGWKAALAIFVNALAVTYFFRGELGGLAKIESVKEDDPVPTTLTAVHLLFLTGIVFFAHHPAVFFGLFLFFLGVAHAYERYQNRLILREGLLVAFFLAGLVVLGGLQHWWLQPLLMAMSSGQVFWGATALTAVTDNAALTYLGSLVEGLSDEFKYSLVAGAVTGGGLTIIANAPNPAGIAILREHFDDQTVHPLWLFVAALPPTLVAAMAFTLL